jgi:hypothetical protein
MLFLQLVEFSTHLSVPSEPGGVGARTIPFGAVQGAEEMMSVLRRLRRMRFGEMARRGGGWAKCAGLGGSNSCRAGKRVQSYPGPT